VRNGVILIRGNYCVVAKKKQSLPKTDLGGGGLLWGGGGGGGGGGYGVWQKGGIGVGQLHQKSSPVYNVGVKNPGSLPGREYGVRFRVLSRWHMVPGGSASGFFGLFKE